MEDLPVLKWDAKAPSDDMTQPQARVFQVIAKLGFGRFATAVVEVCRRYAKVPGRAAELWEFRAAYFSRYWEEERAFLAGRSKESLKHTSEE